MKMYGKLEEGRKIMMKSAEVSKRRGLIAATDVINVPTSSIESSSVSGIEGEGEGEGEGEAEAEAEEDIGEEEISTELRLLGCGVAAYSNVRILEVRRKLTKIFK